MLLASKFDIVESDPFVDKWTLNVAEYFVVEPSETIKERISRIETLMDDDLSLLEDRKELAELFAHGVEETAEVQADPDKFEPEKAIQFLREAAARNLLRAEAMMETEGHDGGYFKESTEFRVAADEMEVKFKKGERIIPKVETINVEISPLSFFSNI